MSSFSHQSLSLRRGKAAFHSGCVTSLLADGGHIIIRALPEAGGLMNLSSSEFSLLLFFYVVLDLKYLEIQINWSPCLQPQVEGA